jgi:hypothetical protein
LVVTVAVTVAVTVSCGDGGGDSGDMGNGVVIVMVYAVITTGNSGSDMLVEAVVAVVVTVQGCPKVRSETEKS